MIIRKYLMNKDMYRKNVIMMNFVRNMSSRNRKLDEVYVHGHHKSVTDSHAKRTASTVAQYMLHLLDKNNTKLLDVGCGPGSITAEFAQLCKHVEGLDVSPQVIETAKNATKGLSNVHLQAASVYELPFEDNTFDVVHAHQVLQHLTDPIYAIKEMTRVAKPGGYVTVREVDYSSFMIYPVWHELEEWRRIYRATSQATDTQPDAGKYLVHWFLEAGYLEDMLQFSAGSVEYGSPQGRKEWGESWKERALKSAIYEKALQHGIATKEEMHAISEAWGRFATYPGAVMFYTNGQIIARKG